jgi:hypothetical protein
LFSGAPEKVLAVVFETDFNAIKRGMSFRLWDKLHPVKRIKLAATVMENMVVFVNQAGLMATTSGNKVIFIR